jgi:hypothetical protein
VAEISGNSTPAIRGKSGDILKYNMQLESVIEGGNFSPLLFADIKCLNDFIEI